MSAPRPETDRERAWRLLELDPEESLGAPRASLLRFSARARAAAGRGRLSARSRAWLGLESRRAARGRVLLRLGLPDLAAGVLAGADAPGALGEALTACGRPREALRPLERALARDGRDYWSRLWLAEALRRGGEPAEAARAWAAARRLRPGAPWADAARGRAGEPAFLDAAAGEPWARLLRGWTRLEDGAFAAAEEDLSAGLAAAPFCRWARLLRARARLGLGRWDAARADFERAMRAAPDLGSARRAWAEGDAPAPELVQLDAAAGRRPDLGWLRAWRGQLHFDALRPERAIEDLRRAAALEPGNGWARALLARAEALWLGDAAAEKRFTRAFADAPSCAWILLWRGLARARRGDRAGAGRDCAAAAARRPDDALARGWAALRRRDLGDLRGALAGLDAAAELDPTYGLHFERRRRVLWRLGLPEAAYEDMSAAVRREGRFRWAEGRAPEDLARADAELSARLAAAPGDAWARAWRGDARLEAGRPAEALADLDAAARVLRSGWVEAWRAEALAKLGRAREASRAAAAAARLEPSYARAHAVRAALLALSGEPRAAVRALDRAIAADFGAAWAYSARARLLLGLGRRAEARADLARALALDGSRGEDRALLAAVPGGGGR